MAKTKEEKAIQFIQNIFGDEIVEKLSAEDTDLERLKDEMTAKQKKEWQEIYNNTTGKEAINNAVKAAEGKFYGTFRSSAKKHFDIEPEELEGLSLPEQIDKISSKIREDMKGAGKEETAKLQQKLTDLSTQIEDYETNKIPAIRQEAQQQLNDKLVDIDLNKRFASVDPSKLIVGSEGREAALEFVNSYLKTKYDIKIEDGQTKFYDKGTDSLAMNEEQTKVLNPNEIIQLAIRKTGLERKSTGSDDAQNNGNSNNVTTGALNERQKKIQEILNNK